MLGAPKDGRDFITITGQDNSRAAPIEGMMPMKKIIAIALSVISMSACSASSSAVAPGRTGSGGSVLSLTEDEKHRLYSAALAASESPLDNETFKGVCRRIGIFDAEGKPNANYMTFVQEHVAWGMKAETEQFRHEINTREKAREYVEKYRP